MTTNQQFKSVSYKQGRTLLNRYTYTIDDTSSNYSYKLFNGGVVVGLLIDNNIDGFQLFIYDLNCDFSHLE